MMPCCSLHKLASTDVRKMAEKQENLVHCAACQWHFDHFHLTWNQCRKNVCSISSNIDLYPEKLQKIFLASEESNTQKCTVVWEICIFSARIFSSTTEELARKCRILGLNERLGGFSESPNDLVPLRRAKILWKRVVYGFFSLLWTETRQLVEIRQYNTNWQLGQSQKCSSIALYMHICSFGA